MQSRQTCSIKHTVLPGSARVAIGPRGRRRACFWHATADTGRCLSTQPPRKAALTPPLKQYPRKVEFLTISWLPLGGCLTALRPRPTGLLRLRHRAVRVRRRLPRRVPGQVQPRPGAAGSGAARRQALRLRPGGAFTGSKPAIRSEAWVVMTPLHVERQTYFQARAASRRRARVRAGYVSDLARARQCFCPDSYQPCAICVPRHGGNALCWFTCTPQGSLLNAYACLTGGQQG